MWKVHIGARLRFYFVCFSFAVGGGELNFVTIVAVLIVARFCD